MVGRFIMAATKYPKIAVDKPMNRQKCKFQDLCLGFQQLGDIKMSSFYWSTWRFSTSQHRSFTPTRAILDCDHAEDLQDACHRLKMNAIFQGVILISGMPSQKQPKNEIFRLQMYHAKFLVTPSCAFEARDFIAWC